MLMSSLRHECYDEKDAVRIINVRQALYYWTHGVQPISIYPSKDYKTNDDVLVFIFSKSKTQELYKEWIDSK